MFDLNINFTEILKLATLLTDEGIPHTLEKFLDGWQICYPDQGSEGSPRVMDAVQNFGSYGHELNLIEIMGLLTPEEQEIDGVRGYLTAEDVFERIKKHYTMGAK